MPPVTALSAARAVFSMAAQLGTGLIIKDVVTTFSPTHTILRKTLVWCSVAAMSNIANKKIDPAACEEFDTTAAFAKDVYDRLQKNTSEPKS